MEEKLLTEMRQEINILSLVFLLQYYRNITNSLKNKKIA